MASTLNQLLTPQTQDQVNQKILGLLQSGAVVNGITVSFPVTDWQTGGIEKTLIAAFAKVITDLSAAQIPLIAGGGLVDYAGGLISIDGVSSSLITAWMPILAQELYNLTQNPATNTIGTIALNCAVGAGPFTISANQLWFLFPSGNRYNGPLTGPVSLQAPGFSSVTHSGGGAGTVTIIGSGGNATGLSVVIKVSTSGTAGAGAFFQWSADSGVTYGPAISMPGGNYTDTASNITVNFSGAFVINDTYSFQSYGQVRISVQSEGPNNSLATPPANYIDPSGSTIAMITPLPGVTATNIAPTYSAVTVFGTSSGTIVLTGSPTLPHSVGLRIDIAGQAGVASWSYSIDGAAYVSAGAVSTASNIGGTGITVTLVNGGGTPSFNAGDTFSFNTPGSWITQQGTDVELPATLAQRCKNRWPALAVATGQGITLFSSPTLGVYDLLARAASNQVTQTLVLTDGTVNNRISLYVAGQGGILPAGVLATVLAFTRARAIGTDFVSVFSPAIVTLQLAGATVKVKAASLVSAQQSIQAALATYFGSLGINASQSDDPGVIEHSVIVKIIRTTFGVTDITDTALTIQLGGGGPVAGNATLPTGGGLVQLVQWTQQIASALTWVTV